MNKEKKSFFERLTGAIKVDRPDETGFAAGVHVQTPKKIERQNEITNQTGWTAEDEPDGELTVDVYQTNDEIVIQTMVAGVRPEDLDISIARDMVTIKGRREASRDSENQQYFHQELYWGAFSRTILLPEEIDTDAAQASEKYGLLTIRLPKVDKNRQTKLRVKTI